MRKYFTITALLTSFLLASVVVEAQEEGVTSSTELGLQISSSPEIKALVTQSFTFPVFRGSSSLTSGNSLKTAFTADLSPISVNGALEFTLTPLAFLQFISGVKAGSGWNIRLFGGDIYGIGINAPLGDENAPKPRKSEVSGEAFDGLLWSAWGGGAFQFDLAAIFPGDWNHVLFRTYHEARYAAYTRAGPGDSWFFEFDDGENRNGWVYNASYVLGYQMPLSPVLNTVAFMADLNQFLYNTPGGDYWGDKLGNWVFSGLFNFTITPAFSTALAVQFHTQRNHGNTTDMENKDFYFYQDFPLDKKYGDRRLVFYRAAVILSYKLR